MDWIPAADKTTLEGKDSIGGTAQKWKVTFTYDDDGKITAVSAAK